MSRTILDAFIMASSDHLSIKPEQKPPEATKCPQCGSDGCGPLRCRFSLIEHDEYKRIAKRIRRAMKTATDFKGTVAGTLSLDQTKRAHYRAVGKTLGAEFYFEQQGHSLLMVVYTKEPE